MPKRNRKDSKKTQKKSRAIEHPNNPVIAENQNQNHNSIKVGMGPNTDR
jgi:hypothetical protein